MSGENSTCCLAQWASDRRVGGVWLVRKSRHDCLAAGLERQACTVGGSTDSTAARLDFVCQTVLGSQEDTWGLAGEEVMSGVIVSWKTEIGNIENSHSLGIRRFCCKMVRFYLFPLINMLLFFIQKRANTQSKKNSFQG